jgi:hypothetical protein
MYCPNSMDASFLSILLSPKDAPRCMSRPLDPNETALIAATAIIHGMTVVTRNVSGFEPTGVTIINPWQP